MSAASDLVSLVIAGAMVLAPMPSFAAPSHKKEHDKPAHDKPAHETATETPPPEATEPPVETPPSEPVDEPKPDAPVDDRAAAAASFLEGSKYYELGQYPLAIEKFEKAWELANEPLLLFNLGQAYWKWFDVDPQAEHLRRAKQNFENYDKRMRGSKGYDPTEVMRFVERINEQLAKAEETAEARVERELKAREEAERRKMWIERERQVVTGLNASGITLITLGSLTLTMGLAGLLTRVANKVVLDQSNTGPNQVNLATAEEDAKRRRQFLVGGQLAYSGFIIGGILLPIGITLKVLGGVRQRRALGRDDKKKKTDVAVSPDGTITVRF
ncbi:MAG TPA: tetratricopeptide repeat protein [Nannocystaceae bacterium]|nr:tetratricopeptide repeat protein [Nannocystaceae bacterium]